MVDTPSHVPIIRACEISYVLTSFCAPASSALTQQCVRRSLKIEITFLKRVME